MPAVAMAAASGPDYSNLMAFQDVVQPILKEKCAGCHNPNKRKGELELETAEAILKGGKSGAVIEPGNPEESHLLQRIHLPEQLEEHMPPAGKPQLTRQEMAILEWWVAQGAPFDKKVGELEISSGVEAIFGKTQAAAPNPVFSLPVPAAGGDIVSRLRQQGISVVSLGENTPWLEVSLAGNQKLDADLLDQIQEVAPQISRLDLSHTNLNDNLLGRLSALPHLTRLNLAYTDVSDAGLGCIVHFPYVEWLNLAGTRVSDAGLAALAAMPLLKTVYGWKSAATASGGARLAAVRPGLKVDMGPAEQPFTTPLPLRPPQLRFARNIFFDTVHVALEFPFRDVNIHYTLDDTEPTGQSARYTGEPLVLDKSAKVRAIAVREGWGDSPIAEASFVRSKLKPQQASLAQPPNPKYPGGGGASLYDGVIAENYLDRAFLGYEGEHLTATLDFGAPVDLNRLSVHCLENNGSWIFSPKGLHAWVSDDGKAWRKCLGAGFPVNSAMQPAQTHVFSEKFQAATKGRYLKVQVESLLKNPAWHPGAGQKCWVFVDEILVE